MPVVALGPKEFKVDLPLPIIDQYNNGTLNAGGIKDYAISHGLATVDDLGLPNSLKETPPTVDGAMQAAMIGAGRETSRIGSQAMQLLADVAGNENLSQREKDFQAEQSRLAEPAKAEYPKSSFAGEVLPGFAIPGGKGTQLAAGMVLGGMEGDTLGERVYGASIGALTGFLGQKAGDFVGQKVQRGLVSLSDAAKARSLRIMQELNIPTTVGQRGSPVGRFFDRVRSTITGSQPLYGKQIRALNKLAISAIGETGNRLDDVTLSRAHTRIGQVYQRAAKEVPFIPSDNAVYSGLKAIESTLSDIGTDSSSVQRSFDTLRDTFFNAKMTGARYLDLRTKFGKLSRQLWKNGAEIDATYVDEMIQLMDDAFTRSAPDDLSKGLVDAGRQWRFLTALRRGSSISPEGNVNVNSLNSALRAKFPGYDVGKGRAGDLGRGVRAMRDVVVPFRSSGTAERLVPIGAAGASVITPQNIGKLAMALAAPFSGGGAGAAAGGNTARELAKMLVIR